MEARADVMSDMRPDVSGVRKVILPNTQSINGL